MFVWLNAGSLVLGLIAWILPIINLVRCNKPDNRGWVAFSVISVSACAIALYMQILYINHLVNIEDWSALMDTSYAVALVCALLLVVTVMLNAVALVVYRRKKRRD